MMDKDYIREVVDSALKVGMDAACGKPTDELRPGQGFVCILNGYFPGEEVIWLAFVQYELADACLVLMETNKGHFVVGTGNCARPYLDHYYGDDSDEAQEVFVSRADQMVENWERWHDDAD